MNNVNKTLYIPLYGKAFVSRKKVILNDTKAEEIWAAEGFELKGKSKWLAYYMGMRSAVFDKWLIAQMESDSDAVIVHIGCGMDGRIERVGTRNHQWFDVDFPDVIAERRRYYKESDEYYMIESDARKNDWINKMPEDKNAIIIMEGVSMYFKTVELKNLLKDLRSHFNHINILMDCYTIFAAKASKYKNPINEVGVTTVYGIDEPKDLTEGTGISYVKEHEMTPMELINELSGFERIFFKNVLGGKVSKKMYRLFEFKST